MANFLSSPGVSLNEIDNSLISPTPVQVGAAIVGPTVKGPKNIPVVVTSYSDYKSRFGGSLISGSDSYTYLTSIAAYNYFENGGTSLLVARVVSGSYTPASSSTIYNDIESGVISTEVDTLLSSLTGVTGSIGTYTISGSTIGTGTGFTASISLDSGTNVTTITATNGGSGYAVGDTITIPSQSIGYGAGTIGTDTIITLTAANIVNNQAFTLETISEGVIMNSAGAESSFGSLTNGTHDNVRWEITGANTGSGTFNVIVRRGDDRTNGKIILEAFNNVNLDPNSSRYISRVIGDQVVTYDSTNNQVDITTGSFPNASRYVRVKDVVNTPNYLDADGVVSNASYTGSIPLNGSGSFGGAVGDVKAGANFYENINDTNTQGLVAGNYTEMASLLANKDDYQFKVLMTPGLIDNLASHASPISSFITNAQNRGDNIYIVDPAEYSATLTAAVGKAQGRNSSYAAEYWPWVQVNDPETGKNVWVPASTVIGGVYAFNDRVSAPWFAPAGLNRGGLGGVLRAKYKLTQAQKDELYENNINPIATFPNAGVVVFGQKTLQKAATALDRVNVRRLLIELKGFIGQVADSIVFDQNTLTTRNKFLSVVNPYLDNIKQKQGLYAFKVVMDDTNNSPDVIDRNQLVGQIYIQPTKTAEFINLDFVVLPTGAEFPA
jgi:uncharacterized protein